MKRVIAILLGAVLMAGCINGKFIKKNVPNSCDGLGWTHTIVHYGDSRVVVIPLSEVTRGQEFRFYLIPQLKGRGAKSYQDAIIKIKGKRDPEDIWFTEISGKASDKFIKTCVKDTLAVGDMVEYTVEVYLPAEVDPRAILDPRAVVIN